MTHLLDNPVYYALVSGDSHLGTGNDQIRIFDPAVSPFAGIRDDHYDGLLEIDSLVEQGRRILIAIPAELKIPGKWKLLNFIEGLQFILEKSNIIDQPGFSPGQLTKDDVKEMMALTALTRPGPFDKNTIDFGHYYGIHENGLLASMAGQRLHLDNFSEISAVCTRPDHVGKGYAGKLLQHQVNLIAADNKIPFLHVRADNDGAIRLYERLGFVVRSKMNFYFLRKI